MKPIHLCLTPILAALFCQQAVAQQYPGRFYQQTPYRQAYFQPPTPPQNMFLAQADGVPVPPEAGQAGAAASGAATTPSTGSNGLAVPPTDAPTTWNAFSPQFGPDPFATDPYGAGAAPYAPYSPYGAGAQGAPGAPFGMSSPFSTYGTQGARPYRQGWHPRLDIEWMPTTGIKETGRGDFGQFGVNYDFAYTGPFMPGWMFTWTNQFRLRSWDGPDGLMPGGGLPGSAYRLGVDFELETPHAGPVSLSLAVTPSINTDFDASLGSTAFQLDGRGMFIFQMDQFWTLVLGAGFWDRVDDRVIPYAGLVYRDDLWEWRLMYPESMVSVFLGNGPGGATWMYVRAEYVVEAYEVLTTAGTDEVELEDYRAVLGFRSETGLSEWFLEGGVVFARDVAYNSAVNTPFSPDTGFFLRTGWTY